MTFSERATKAILHLRHNQEWLAIMADIQRHYDDLVMLAAHAQSADQALLRAGALREMIALMAAIETAQRADQQSNR